MEASPRRMILEPGAVAPDFDLVNQFGQRVRLADFRGVKPVTLVFFPLAFSRVCQGELCELRDNFSMFDDATRRAPGRLGRLQAHPARLGRGARGTRSSSSPTSGRTAQVAAAYGAFDDVAGTAHRATFVIGADGVIASSFATPRGEARPLERYRDAIAAL